MNNEPQNNPQRPVAYDPEGRPLYYQPPQQPEPVVTPAPAPTAAAMPVGPAPATLDNVNMVNSRPEAYEGYNFDPRMRTQWSNEPGIVQTARAYEPQVPEISDALRRKHEEAVAHYPHLNLSEGEFVILDVKRHPIGMLRSVLMTMVAVLILLTLLILLPNIYQAAHQATIGIPIGAIVGFLILVIVIVGLLGASAVWVYTRNQFYLTNEGVIQELQYGLFSRREQTVSLGSIEDASFKQTGLLASIFNYGEMRLSTEGEETTYRFSYVANPRDQVAVVSNAVEAFKNGRPVGTEYLK